MLLSGVFQARHLKPITAFPWHSFAPVGPQQYIYIFLPLNLNVHLSSTWNNLHAWQLKQKLSSFGERNKAVFCPLEQYYLTSQSDFSILFKSVWWLDGNISGTHIFVICIYSRMWRILCWIILSAATYSKLLYLGWREYFTYVLYLSVFIISAVPDHLMLYIHCIAPVTLDLSPVLHKQYTSSISWINLVLCQIFCRCSEFTFSAINTKLLILTRFLKRCWVLQKIRNDLYYANKL